MIRLQARFHDLQSQILARHGLDSCIPAADEAAILLQFLREMPVFMPAEPAFTDVPTAIKEIRAGRMIVVIDDEDRENEGDLTMAAEKVTPEAINFMAKFGRGLICMPMTGERLDKLEIPLMVEKNSTRFETAFCVAIEAKRGTSTGISAADRAATVKAAINPKTK